LWHKGATSGQIQKITEIRTDCDQDVILLQVVPQRTGACHVGYNSCFFRSVQKSESGDIRLTFEETEKVST
jgi:phosphoribosyl-AMP cyclohydrolase